MPGYSKTDPFGRLQTKALDTPVVTNFLRVVILETTAPGTADGGRDFAPISEIVVIGGEQLP